MSFVVRTFSAFLLLLFTFPALCQAQAPAPSDEIARLREQIASQQKQLNDQRQLLDEQQKALDAQQKALDRLLASQPVPAASSAPTSSAALPDLHGKSASTASLAPLSFRIGGADFTPGGFIDFTAVWRSTNVGTGIATSFGAIPFGNTSAGRMMETRSSAQNSRLSLAVTGSPIKGVAVTGYVETDFLGAQPANGYITSNSNSLRLRQGWINLRKGKWEFLGGQAWTLLTPNRVGLSPVPADLFIGLEQDSNYQVGLTWGRTGQFRVVYHPNDKWALAVSAETPEQYVTSVTTLPSCVNSQIGNGSATTTPNPRPDVIAKIAYDTKLANRAFHFELAGLSRQFETSPAPSVHMSAQGVGGSFDALMEVAKNFRLILTSFYSSGGGRYDLGLGPDLIVGPNGSISPVHSMSGVGGFEYKPTAKSQFYAYYGADYFQRNYVAVGPGEYLGFGFPGSSNAANRQIQEPTFGYIRTFWKNPNYGALQLITQYSWVTRAPWSVPAGTPSTAQAHMVYGAMRFVLP